MKNISLQCKFKYNDTDGYIFSISNWWVSEGIVNSNISNIQFDESELYIFTIYPKYLSESIINKKEYVYNECELKITIIENKYTISIYNKKTKKSYYTNDLIDMYKFII